MSRPQKWLVHYFRIECGSMCVVVAMGYVNVRPAGRRRATRTEKKVQEGKKTQGKKKPFTSSERFTIFPSDGQQKALKWKRKGIGRGAGQSVTRRARLVWRHLLKAKKTKQKRRRHRRRYSGVRFRASLLFRWHRNLEMLYVSCFLYIPCRTTVVFSLLFCSRIKRKWRKKRHFLFSCRIRKDSPRRFSLVLDSLVSFWERPTTRLKGNDEGHASVWTTVNQHEAELRDNAKKIK